MPERENDRIEIDIESGECGEEAVEHELEPVPGARPQEVAGEPPGPPGEAAAGEGDEAGLRAELAELRDRYLRKLAEFDNFRKRTEREKAELWQQAAADLIGALVPVLDNFERALEHADADPGSLRLGVEMIARQLWDILERQGLERIDPAGEPFDPQVHEAVQRVDEGDHEPGTVVQVLAKGYRLRGRLIRPAMVAVAVERTPGEAASGDGGNGAEGAQEGGETP